jgi:hypothetical protein
MSLWHGLLTPTDYHLCGASRFAVGRSPQSLEGSRIGPPNRTSRSGKPGAIPVCSTLLKVDPHSPCAAQAEGVCGNVKADLLEIQPASRLLAPGAAQVVPALLGDSPGGTCPLSGSDRCTDETWGRSLVVLRLPHMAGGRKHI